MWSRTVCSDPVLGEGSDSGILSKSHILMQGLETLIPTPDLSSLLTSFKWISLCLRVRLRIMELIQQRDSTQPTPSQCWGREFLLRLPVGGSLAPRTLCGACGGATCSQG